MKLGVVAIVWGHTLLGDATSSMAALVSGDLVYVALFRTYLKGSSTDRDGAFPSSASLPREHTHG